MGYLSRYKKILPEAKQEYEEIGSVHCPYFNDEVAFNAMGFHHLRFSAGSERSKKAQLYKFSLVPDAVAVVKDSGTLQQYRKQLGAVGRKKSKSGHRETKMMTYWAFEAITDVSSVSGKRVKVVVRQIGDGKKHFWSVMSDTNVHRKSNYKLATDDVVDG